MWNIGGGGEELGLRVEGLKLRVSKFRNAQEGRPKRGETGGGLETGGGVECTLDTARLKRQKAQRGASFLGR